jgi:ABC-type transporter Mla subunit MlaD
MAAKKTFADDAKSFAEDVQEFIADTREAFGELVDRHSEVSAAAKPEADEGDVWSNLSRTSGVFGDVERALTMLASTVQALADSTMATLGARDADDDVPAYAPGQTSTVPPQGPTPAESKEAEEAAEKASAEADKADEPKKAVAKKSS